MAVDIELIKGHARFFDHLVDLIPARFYSDDADQKVNLFSLKKAERQKVKQEFKLQYKVNKRSKLDPDAPATTLEQQKAAAASKDEERAGPSGHSLNLSGSKLTREELKERLQQKIEAIAEKRNLKEKKQDKKQDKKDKKAVAQKAKEWRQKALEDNARQKQAEQAASEGGQAGSGGKRKAADSGGAAATAGGKQGAAKKARQEGGKQGGQAADADGDFQFARMQFDDGRPVPGPKGRKPTKEQLLASAEAKQAELAAAAAAGEEGRVKVMQEAWKTAMARAGGEKVLDDPKLLKKSLKKEAKRKEKAGKAWAERNQAQVDKQAAKQAKRTENLNTRTATKIENKKAKREKKLLRAGFEGRKSGYIGGEGKGGDKS